MFPLIRGKPKKPSLDKGRVREGLKLFILTRLSAGNNKYF